MPMTVAIWILLVQASLGAFDTLYYHEYKLKLAHNDDSALELRLHAARDFAYAIIIGTLGWATWQGALAYVLFGLLIMEICITLWDFIEEDKKRKLPAGERAMHAIMGIVYGAFLAYLFPELWRWSQLPTGWGAAYYGIPAWLLSLIATGVFVSGVRDLLATFGVREGTAKA
jgi:uncharacterized protein